MVRRSLLVTAALACLTLLVWAGATFTRNALHVPRLSRPAGGETVEVTAADGARLRGSWFPARASAKCVVILHGIGDSRASAAGFAPFLVERGFSVLAPDSRGHGESGGDLVTYGLLESDDVLRWAGWMRQRNCGNLYGLGESLGGAILIQAAAAKPVFSAIVAESAYSDLALAARERTAKMLPLPDGPRRLLAWTAVTNGQWYARAAYGLDLARASPLESMRKLQVPVLLIHGLADDATPADHSRRLAAANPAHAQLWLVEGLGHQSAAGIHPAEYWRRVLSWFGGA